jgi:hypothetical protein
MPLVRIVRKSETRAAAKSSPIFVHVGNARIEVSADVDRSTLSVVLEALASVSWEGKLRAADSRSFTTDLIATCFVCLTVHFQTARASK